MFDRLARAHRNTRPLMEAIGVHAMGAALDRLTSVLKPDEGIRSGDLTASLTAAGPGTATEHTVFRLSDHSVEVGTNLPYAAQVHFGGTIKPRQAKSLAIPLPDALKRSGLGPREYDPTGERLHFRPVRGGKPNVFGLLFDDDKPMYALAWSVTQPARPFMGLDDADIATIRDEIYPEFCDQA